MFALALGLVETRSAPLPAAPIAPASGPQTIAAAEPVAEPAEAASPGEPRGARPPVAPRAHSTSPTRAPVLAPTRP